MANYNLTLNNAEEITFSNEALTKETRNYVNACNRGQKAVMDMAKAITNVKNKDLWKDDFESFADYYDKALGLKKAQAYKLIQGYEIYSRYQLTDFNNTQCVALFKLDKAKGEKGVKEALESGVINRSMPSKEIEAVVERIVNPEKVAAKEAEKEAKIEEMKEKNEAAKEAEFQNIICQISVIGTGVKVDTLGDFKLSAKDIEKIEQIFSKYVNK